MSLRSFSAAALGKPRDVIILGWLTRPDGSMTARQPLSVLLRVYTGCFSLIKAIEGPAGDSKDCGASKLIGCWNGNGTPARRIRSVSGLWELAEIVPMFAWICARAFWRLNRRHFELISVFNPEMLISI
jgi:hypothetical protein